VSGENSNAVHYQLQAANVIRNAQQNKYFSIAKFHLRITLIGSFWKPTCSDVVINATRQSIHCSLIERLHLQLFNHNEPLLLLNTLQIISILFELLFSTSEAMQTGNPS